MSWNLRFVSIECACGRRFASRAAIVLPAVVLGAWSASCGDSHTPTGSGGHATTSTGQGGSGASGSTSTGPVTGPCTLPGSLQFKGGAPHLVPGGKPGHDLSFLKLPTGFCAHWFGSVGNARQLRFAPGGELFVASPTTLTTGGGAGGLASIVVLPDDDGDGYADKVIQFLTGLPSTQGMLFANDSFYFQDHTQIRRLPYAKGDRQPSGASTKVVDITVYEDTTHWPKTLDIADDGTIYVSNGGDQGETCITSHPFHGGILKIDGSPGGAQVAKGFRNPIAVRCSRGKNRCFALELALDFSAPHHGREKVVPIHQGDDWGFPCCATTDLPYKPGGPDPNCGGVTSDHTSFFIGDTPFGIAFQPAAAPWPGAWKNRAIIALHGAAGSWTGARVVAVDIDPDTGLLLPGTNIHARQDEGAITRFADGWDDGTVSHGRPAAVDFSDDGRLFLGNDNDGSIIWIAPLQF